MRIPHLHAALLNLSPDGAVIDAEVPADLGERLPCFVQPDGFRDLLIGQWLVANRDAGIAE